MKISVNGKPMEIEPDLSVEGLLTLLSVKREFTAVAVNRDVIRRADYAAARLSAGDKVEIVRPMGGG